jgi:predicted RNase H-like HicB family nuclease
VKLRCVVKFDSGVQRWSAVFPELPGCATTGDTEAEAVENAREALSLWFKPSPMKLDKNTKLFEIFLP